MKCEKCGEKLIVYSCKEEKNIVIRYRKCDKCGKTYKTIEKLGGKQK